LCKGNLKQLGIGVTAYVNDYNDFLPASYTSNISPYQTWVTDVGNQINPAFDTSRQGVRSSLFICPSDTHILQAPPTGCCPPCGPDVFRVSYGFNASITNYSPEYRRISKITKASKTLMACDIGGVVCSDSTHYCVADGGGSRLFSGVHRNLINILFVDGNVGQGMGVPGTNILSQSQGFLWGYLSY